MVAHERVKTIKEDFGELQPDRVARVDLLQRRHELRDHAAHAVVRVVVFAVLDVVAAEYLDLAEVGVLLPVDQVHLLQQLRLVVLQLAQRHGRASGRVGDVDGASRFGAVPCRCHDRADKRLLFIAAARGFSRPTSRGI